MISYSTLRRILEILLLILFVSSCSLYDDSWKEDYYSHNVGMYFNGVEYHDWEGVTRKNGIFIDHLNDYHRVEIREYSGVVILECEFSSHSARTNGDRCDVFFEVYCNKDEVIDNNVLTIELYKDDTRTVVIGSEEWHRLSYVVNGDYFPSLPVLAISVKNKDSLDLINGKVTIPNIYSTSDSANPKLYTCDRVEFSFNLVAEDGTQYSITDGYCYND